MDEPHVVDNSAHARVSAQRVESSTSRSSTDGAMQLTSEAAPITTAGSVGTTGTSAPAAQTQESAALASDTGDADAKKRDAQLGRELFVFTAQKAGMHDVNTERVQQVVLEMSKNSSFYKQKLKQNDKVNARIAEMQQRLAALTDAKRKVLQQRIDMTVAQLEATRDLSRTIVVVDMDMFYAAVEMRDDPKLRDVPLAVGGPSMISTTNYIARKFGVRAAMPGFIGKELCPSLVFVAPNFAKYTAVAAQIRAIFAEYDPHYSSFSLDEARLDITDYMDAHWREYIDTGAATHTTAADPKSRRPDSLDSAHDSSDNNYSDDDDGDDDRDDASRLDERDRVHVAAAIVAEIRQKIHATTELTASAGVAANTMLAKIASDMNKPNGQFVLPFTRDDVVGFIQRQPVRKIGGIGKVMEKILAAIGITTGADLFTHRVALFHIFSDKTGPWLLRTSLAIKEVREATGRKSYSRERTFQNLSDAAALEAKCRKVCAYLADDMARGSVGARTLTLKLKCADFSVRSRSVSFATTLRTEDELFASAVAILRKELPLTLRLLGVRASSLVAIGDPSGAASVLASGGAGETKRQLGIDQFAVATTSDACVPDERGESASDSSDDVLTADEDADGGTTTHSTGSSSSSRAMRSASGAMRQSARRSSSSIANFVAPLAADATSDIVAAMLATSALTSSSRSASRQNDAGATESGSAAAQVVRAEPASPQSSSFQPCPICRKMINASNAITISTHVDACIRQTQAPAQTRLQSQPRLHRRTATSRRGASGRSRSSGKRARDGLFTDALVCYQPCPICSERMDASSSKLVNAHIDACILSSAASASDAGGDRDSAVPCPSCGEAIHASDAVAVNAHVDVCTSASRSASQSANCEDLALSRASPSSPGTLKRRRRGAQQHSIRSFFASS